MIVVVVAAVMAGALVQGATGFGFALVAAPLLVAAVGPHEAVGALLVLGIALNAATLLIGERPQPLGRTAAGLAAYALPGLALGALALATLPERVLSAAVCLAVLAGVATRSLRVQRTKERGQAGFLHVAAGVAAGALTTSTGANGPPLVLYLLHVRATPAQMRDTLAVLFLSLAVAGTVVLLVSGGLELPGATPALLAATLIGHELGRRVFATLDARRYERAVLALLTLTAAAAGAAAVL